MKSVLKIIYTGGTLGMQASPQGLIPASGLSQRFDQALNSTPGATQRLRDIEWSFVERSPLLDSSNMTPADWESIARDCADINNISGLVIIHGTDTLAYTASALAYLLADTSIPVVVTGSQKPLTQANSDALENLLGAMLAASHGHTGVWVYFNQYLMPAARSVKKDAIHFDGFAAPRAMDGLPHLPAGQALTPPLLQIQQKPRDWADIHVASVHMTPGYAAQHLTALINTRPNAIVLSLYGLGTLADQNEQLLAALEDARDKNIILVAISQCYIGNIDFDIYATGQSLKQLGVLSGKDMTLEAAYSKLMILFRMGYSIDEVRQLFSIPIANEMSVESV